MKFIKKTVISHYSSSQNTMSKKKTEILKMLFPISKQKPPPHAPTLMLVGNPKQKK